MRSPTTGSVADGASKGGPENAGLLAGLVMYRDLQPIAAGREVEHAREADRFREHVLGIGHQAVHRELLAAECNLAGRIEEADVDERPR
jgi:hypothetical protein